MAVDSSTRISQAQSAAIRAERDAAARIQESQKKVQTVAKEEEKQIDGLRDQYARRSEVERARGENYIETVKNRNYESLSETRRKAETDKSHISRTAEKDLKDLDAHYGNAIVEANRRGDTQLKEATKKGFEAEQLERSRYADELEGLKLEYEVTKAQLSAERENTTTVLTKATQNHRKESEEKTRTDIENSNEHYQEIYTGAVKQNRDAVMDMNWRAARDVENMKRETSLKLDAYANQKSDPFYRMVNIEANIQENSDNFILTAKIPPHERDKININVRGNELVISGKRKSEETLEASPGHTIRTNAYQSFSETFPLSWPVDPKFMTREWSGDDLIVRIPKRTTYEPPKVKPEVARARLERPNFPKNLPTEDQLIAINTEDNTTPPSRRKPGATIG